MLLNKRFNLICGHYGCGKTNLALNLARDCAQSKCEMTTEQKNALGGMTLKGASSVTLVDMDLVNPYFRSSDFAHTLQEENIRVIAPVYANSNVDVPSLPAELYGIFDSEDTVIVDVGGDEVGATVLGRFHAQISSLDYDMFIVVNRYRNLTGSPKEAAEVLKEIERVSRLKATALIHNSHLKSETTVETLLSSLDYAREVSELTGLPIRAMTVPRELLPELTRAMDGKNHRVELYPIDIICKSCFE